MNDSTFLPTDSQNRLLLTRLVLLAILVTSACSDSATGPTEGRVKTGVWGGTSAGLQVTQTGATARFSCGRGQIDEPLILDRDGRFDVFGTYFVEVGPSSIPHTARFLGRIEGNELTLTVRLLDTNQNPHIGTFVLTFGILFQGPFCA